jgi:hypothetical protein
LLAFEINDAEILPLLHNARPGFAGRNDFIDERSLRHGWIPEQGKWKRSGLHFTLAANTIYFFIH